jgi:hypothetical protein
MQVYKDKYKNIYTDLDYCEDQAGLETFSWVQEKENFYVDHEDFVASVPGSMTLLELDKNLEEFKMCSNIFAPDAYSISKILAEYQDRRLLQKVLGLNLTHLDESITQAGSKVIKDVSGYDMKKLYIGSFNSLALIANAFLKLEKRFDNQLIFEFEMKKDLNQLFKLRNYLQSFLDHRISLKVLYRKLSGNFSVSVKTTEHDKILAYRQKAIINFLEKELSLSSKLTVTKGNFNCDYKEAKRIEVDFDFSMLNLILTEVKEDILLEPLLGLITMNDYQDLSKLLHYVSNVKVFPVTLFNRKLARTMTVDDDEQKLVAKLKKLYDHKLQLNPGVL